MSKLKKDVKSTLNIFGVEWCSISDKSSDSKSYVFRVSTEDRMFGLKMYPEEYGLHNLRSEVCLLDYLSEKGLPVIEPTSNHHKLPFVVADSGRMAFLYKWVDGERRFSVGEREVKSILVTMSKVHLSSINFYVSRDDDWLWSDAIRCLGEIEPPEHLCDWINNTINQGRPWKRNSPELWVTHNDLSLKNIIWATGSCNPFLIDFTNAILAPRHWDIATLCADLLIRGIYSDSEYLINRCAEWYERPGSALSLDLSVDLLECALAQRGVFLAYASQNTTDWVWFNLDKAHKTLPNSSF